LLAVTYARALRHAWASAQLALRRFQSPTSVRCALRAALPQPPAPIAKGTRQLLIDVSVLVRHDGGTGIQRVTKALLGELVKSPPEGYVVRAICGTRWRSYRYVETPRSSSKVQVRSGDIFLGLDLASRILPRHQSQLLQWRANGGSLCFVMYDLLPLLYPDWFTGRNARAFRAWIRTVAIHADSVICISQSVAGQFRNWLASQGFDRESSPKIGWFHLGVRLLSKPAGASQNPRVAQIAQRPFVLMVGTIEPRKGYAMVLDAFDEIWEGGHSMQLVIVGRTGWKVESLVARLHKHKQAGHRLHWFDSADDRTLCALYDAASGVLVASEAEGFGLPILEAAAHGKPLLIRDLPVFREIAGDAATRFRGEKRSQFVDNLRDWLTHLSAGTAVSSRSIALQSWEQSAQQLLHQALPVDPPTF
jgi:glycosyltransferase involved in cell wall biosynthesis